MDDVRESGGGSNWRGGLPIDGKTLRLLDAGPIALALYDNMSENLQVDKKRTMIWYRIDPFVQSGIELSDDMLFPLLPDKPKQRLRLVDGILLAVIDQQMSARHVVPLTIVLSAKAKIWLSFRYAMKKDIFDGFPGGCLKASLGSVGDQYSSSHSTGRSRSKLVSKGRVRHLVLPIRIEPTLHLAVHRDARGPNLPNDLEPPEPYTACEIGNI